MEDKKIVEGYVLSAIDMEERFSHGVYLDYADRKNWPDNINDKTFRKIQSLLKILISDTAKHEKILTALKKKLAQL